MKRGGGGDSEKKAGPLKEIRKRMPFSLSLVWVKSPPPARGSFDSWEIVGPPSFFEELNFSLLRKKGGRKEENVSTEPS